MRLGLKLLVAALMGLPLIQSSAQTNEPPAFKDDKEKASYAAGMYFGNMIKRANMEIDFDVMMGAFKDALAGKEMKLTEPQVLETLRAYQQASMHQLAEKNEKAAAAFLAENVKKEGVKVQSVKLPNGTTAEFRYKILTNGTGPLPKGNDLVTVNLHGTLLDGKEFVNSAKSGQIKRPINTFLPGAAEALRMMPVGSKWELYIPSSLGYGDRGGPNVEPGSMQILEVELLGTEAPPPPPPTHQQPMTSDIIKVPSAEEMKKGAKVEVIKPEDVEKQAAAQTNSSAPKKN